MLWACEKITTSAEQDFSCGSSGGNRNSLEVEMRADIVKASILDDSELRQNWKVGRPEQKTNESGSRLPARLTKEESS